ncbi:protein kinase PINOID-like [Dorcoceras hygrometricum]|uniref:Protein kinase PINOID-like n=1 Tax=Dorcoceras hygrometricum TaxID=472368 RepID=A0A2Z7CX71_9LAMI|nr:protein kinase PINOID-like [Dorcoceras hygrometricum]
MTIVVRSDGDVMISDISTVADVIESVENKRCRIELTVTKPVDSKRYSHCSKNNTVAKSVGSNDEKYCYKVCRMYLIMNTTLVDDRNFTVSIPVGRDYYQYNNQVLLADVIILNAPLTVDF